MKRLLILIFSLTYGLISAQQASVIEPNSLAVPRFENQAAIDIAIPVPDSAMLVFNRATSSYQYYDGLSWSNLRSFWSAQNDTTIRSNVENIRVGNGPVFYPSVFTVSHETFPRAAIGHTGAFNEINSGELVFTEDFNFPQDCGLKFQHNGASNSLYLIGGCSSPDTVARFNRSGFSNIRRLRLGTNYNFNAINPLQVDGNSSFEGDVTITGDLNITGNISKGGGTFRIDHPLDPSNKYLVHSFVESPDMMNLYSGNVFTDSSGFAIVNLPSYFEASNKDYRYQLTVIGTFAQAIIKEKISDNQFVIQTSEPNVEVSWAVTGVRADKYAEANRVVPEQDKEFKDSYVHPALYGASESRSVNSIRQTEQNKSLSTFREADADRQ